jgi:hypothetical protein
MRVAVAMAMAAGLVLVACSSGKASKVATTQTTGSTTTAAPAASTVPATSTTGAPAIPPTRVWVLTGAANPAGLATTDDLVAVDLPSGAVGVPIPLPVDNADFVAVNRAGTLAFVINGGGSGGPTQVLTVDLSTGQAGPTISLPGAPEPAGPTSVAFSPDDDTAYFVDAFNGQLDPVNLSTMTAGSPIPVGPLAACGDVETEAAVTPDGQDVYIEGSGGLFDVDLTKNGSSPAFHLAVSGGSGAYGNVAIGLDPSGSTLYGLQPGQQSDALVPVSTNGDNAGTAINVPVGTKPVYTSQAAQVAPSWDKVFAPTDSTVDVVEFGSVPEQIVPVEVPGGTAGTPVVISSTQGQSGCGDQSPVPIAIAPGGQIALVGQPGSPQVHTVTLPGGAGGAAESVGTHAVLAILSGSGWPDSWPD